MARMQRGCGELVLAMVGQQRGDAPVDLDASVGRVLLHIASRSLSLWQSGLSEMDVQGNFEEEPVNLLGEMKLKVRGKFFTRVQVAQSVDFAATRWVGCLCEVMFSQTRLGEFRPNELRVKRLPATMGLLWHPWCKRTRRSRKQDFGWEGVEGDNDSNKSDADLPSRELGAEAVSDEDPLQLEEDCDEPGNHVMEERIQSLCLEASTRHGVSTLWTTPSVWPCMAWTVQLLRLLVIQHTRMSRHRCQERWPLHRWRNQSAAKAYQALSQWCLQRESSHGTSILENLLQRVSTFAIKEGRGADGIGRATLARCLQQYGLWESWLPVCCHHTRIQLARNTRRRRRAN